MKVNQLIQLLEDCRGSLDGDDIDVKIVWWNGDTEDVSFVKYDDGTIEIEAKV